MFCSLYLTSYLKFRQVYPAYVLPGTRKYLGVGEYNKLCFLWLPCIRLNHMIGAFQFVLDTPKCKCVRKRREVAKRSAANWHHGSCTPTVGLTEPPSLPAADWLPLGLWLDGSIIIFFVGYGETGSCPIFWVGIFRWLPCYCFSAGSGVPLHTLMLITITKRMYLANEYFVVKELSRFRHTTKNWARVFILSPSSPRESLIFPSTQKFFWFFLWVCPYACKLLSLSCLNPRQFHR